MQHLDEGTIHSWLDGALSAEEAARVEVHVAQCPQCAAAVAEARGFIAASSRILTALDHVPRGVVPAPSPVQWYNRSAWRAAAAVLVVAVGSLVVVRNGERSSVAEPASTAASAADSQNTVARPQVIAASPEPAAVSKTQASAPATSVAPRTTTFGAMPSRKSAAEPDLSGKRVDNVAQSSVIARESAQNQSAGRAADAYAGAPPRVAGVVTTSQSALALRAEGVSALDSASGQLPLRVIGTPKTIGAKVTLYEVAPGDTVTFTEASNAQLDAMVVTGMSSTEPQARRSMEKSAARPTAQTAAPSPSVPPSRVEVANGVTTISWSDASTGSMLRLSGRMPVERLKEIKLRIERERAAAAAKKKP
ncbi:MAG: hypothetical protein QOH22_368 [Gemmatimonadaceae bacterium]|jgi:anti-sigma factor RsiW|nr:hypothetical protein [Gemmatimonadaceae bacterium]